MLYVIFIGVPVALAILGEYTVWLQLRAENRRNGNLYRQDRSAHQHVMRLKYGNTCCTQAIRVTLIVLHKLIQASPAAQPPPFAGRAEQHPGTAAAAGGERATPPSAPPPPLPSPSAPDGA